MIEIELLAPARNVEIGIAAITHGADAVYIAADKFGAREKAGNSINDIKTLVVFAHQFHARVYVTVNTIFFDNEVDQVEKLINELYQINVDAIIIQDFSILSMKIPPIALHASTQMHNISIEKVKFLQSYGVSRVVLPRELSLNEISNFFNCASVELEFFIHGALCVSYSGQCYMSQAITGRSANRGACAQPCRSVYNLVDEDGNYLAKNKHLLSLKDFNLSNHINGLINAGVTSFKIEGRLKDISYVKNITAYYSQIINSYICTHHNYKRQSSGSCTYGFIPDPERSFNRGFTTFFIDGQKKGISSMNTQKSIGKLLGIVSEIKGKGFKISTSEDIRNGDGLCYMSINGLTGFNVSSLNNGLIIPEKNVPIPALGTSIYRNADISFEKVLKGNSAKRTISVTLCISQSDSDIAISATDEDGFTAKHVTPNIFETAKNAEASNNNLLKQLQKTGSTIFTVSHISTEGYSKSLFIPISAINTIRRQLFDKLLEIRINQHKLPKRCTNSQHEPYPYRSINYKGNIANHLSKEFIESTGAEVLESAFEIEQPKSQVELMLTKYCIKYELNLCPHKQSAEPTKKLFLEDNNHRYPLVFDCANCQMKVMKWTD